MFITGAVHGDELTGVAIVKKIMTSSRLKNLKGTLIAIPIVNVFGFNNKSRYLPDRRDLNRCFPGTAKGSLASRLANLLIEEVVKKSDYGLDFHSGAIYKTNLPQIRANLADDAVRELAEEFGVPVVLDAKLRDGSLRAVAASYGVNILVYEGGEALRLEKKVVRYGVDGAFAIMEKVGMLPKLRQKHKGSSYIATSSYWVRAPQGGIVDVKKSPGSKVVPGTILCEISDAFGNNRYYVKAPTEGIIIGQFTLPLVNKGDAMFHIATFEDSEIVRELEKELHDYHDTSGI